MNMKKKKVTHRILFQAWVNSQLSIARHYGGCTLNGKTYIFDPDMMEPDENDKVKPDLITYDAKTP